MPAWSPDGTAIVFARGYPASSDLYRMNADGSSTTRLTDFEGYEHSPTWSPGGTRIAFESRSLEAPRINLFDIDDGTVTDQGPGSLPRWSPDGARLAFVSDRAGNLDVFVMDADGANVYQLTTGPERDTLPSWSPDGETILYVSFDVTSP